MGPSPRRQTEMVPKTPKKSKAPKAQKTPKAPKEGPHHRAAHLKNVREFACPECWTIPETIRTDGISVARHEIPAGSKARKFRDTKFCNGQGRTARHVLDNPWDIGTKPKVSISAEEFVAHGTTRIDARLAEKAEREQRKAAKAAKPKAEPKPKVAKAKPAPKPKAAKSSAKPRKAKPSADGATEASTEAPAAA